MKRTKTRQTLRIIAGAILIIWTLMNYVGSVVMLNSTFVEWWIPGAVSFGIAVISGLLFCRMWRWLTGSDIFWLNLLCHMVFFTGLIMQALLLTNHCASTGNVSRHEKALVERVYREKHYKTRRINRRVSVRGEPYYVYRADVCLNDGNTSTINLSRSRYDALHKGDTLGVVVREGFFGWDELRLDSIRYPARKKKQPRTKNRRYRPSGGTSR